MDQKQTTPISARQNTGANDQRKDSKIILTPTQSLLISYLGSGGMYSVADISAALRLCDPRGMISILRSQGMIISDTWCTTSNKTRYKRYFIKQAGL